MQGLRVFPERMRANLDVDGGLLMAEAAMMALAPVVGRAGAHASVTEASSLARDEGITLRAALERTLESETAAALPPLDEILDPAAYLGETDSIVSAAIEAWSAIRAPSPPEAGRAPP
jgi:3-carboxy-cis,cis-muconate cycloisomerase